MMVLQNMYMITVSRCDVLKFILDDNTNQCVSFLSPSPIILITYAWSVIRLNGQTLVWAFGYISVHACVCERLALCVAGSCT